MAIGMDKPVVTLKIGGVAASDNDTLSLFLTEMAALSDDFRFVLVHGGGKDVTAVTQQYGIEPVFEDGIRKTSDEEMPIVDMALAGLVNKRLVRMCFAHGVSAVGCSGVDGATLIGESIGQSRTGSATKVDPRYLNSLLGNGWVPIVAPVSMEKDGAPLNINADEAALEIAASIATTSLIFLSDIPGILKNGDVIDKIDSSGVESEISSGVIRGGMIPKVRSSLDALRRGVQRITIGQYLQHGDLAALLEGSKGSQITI